MQVARKEKKKKARGLKNTTIEYRLRTQISFDEEPMKKILHCRLLERGLKRENFEFVELFFSVSDLRTYFCIRDGIR